MKKKKISQKQEIIWNLINSGLAGVLVLLGSFTSGNITKEGVCVAVATSLVVAFSQFKDYWNSEKAEYSHRAFSFIK